MAPSTNRPSRRTAAKSRSRSHPRQADAHDAEVGRRIRTQRLASGMSQTDLGQQVGVTFQQIQKYENGANRVGAGRLRRLADALQVPPAYFFPDGDGAEPPGMQFMTTAGAFRLVKAYSEISDASLRRSLTELAEQLAAQSRVAARANPG